MRGGASENSASCFRTEQIGVASISEQETEFVRTVQTLALRVSSTDVRDEHPSNGEDQMSKEEDNKAVVGRWFTHFWGKTCDLGIVDELAAPEIGSAPWRG